MLRWMKANDKFDLVLYFYNELARSFMLKRKFNAAHMLLNDYMREDVDMNRV